MPKQVTITPEVRAVLSAGRAEGNTYFLPAGQLDRDLYLAVNKVLTALGGKWNKQAGGHVFARGLGEQLTEALASGVAVDKKRTAEQFFTPPEVAARMFEKAELLLCHHVLEPSAGAGALLTEPLRLHCPITAVEQDRDLAINLKSIVGNQGVTHCSDFLQWQPRDTSPPIDRVLMNPPFGRGKDMAHVTHALKFLAPGGRLVAIMSPHWTFAEDAQSREFRLMLDWHKSGWEPLPEGSFKSAGTSVSTGILTINKGN